jgi:hypothetical protein
MNPQVSIDRILTFQSCFIAVGSVSEPGLHQSISWIPAGECGQSTSPQSVRTAGFVLPAIGLRSNKTVTWHPIPDVLHQAHTKIYPVSDLVNSPRTDDARCIEPVRIDRDFFERPWWGDG